MIVERKCQDVFAESRNINDYLIILVLYLHFIQARSQGGARGPAAPPPPPPPPPPPAQSWCPQKTQKMKPPCYCWQYRPQTQPIIDQATDLTVCKIGSLRDVLSGVPQGSVLGPLLFVLFVNDLPDSVKNVTKLFADDLKLIADASDKVSIENDLSSLEEWESL